MARKVGPEGSRGGDEMEAVTCPACGAPGEAAPGVGGFRCKSCQRDVWVIRCHKCSNPSVIHGSATGAGAVEFRCDSCRKRNTITKQALRAISAEARRVERVQAAARRESSALARESKLHQAEARKNDAERKNSGLHSYVEKLRGVLTKSLQSDTPFGFDKLKTVVQNPVFEPGALATPEDPPELGSFLPAAPKGIGSVLPGAKRKHRAATEEANSAFNEAVRQHGQREAERTASLAAAETEYEKKIADLDETTRRQHADVDELERRFALAEAEAVSEYISAALAALSWPFEQTADPRVAFSSESRQLVIELELPTMDVVPEVREYRYVKSRDEITASAMPVTERKRLYASLIAQVTLRTLHAAFRGDPHAIIETIVINGHVHTVDKRTGQSIHPCLVTVRAGSDRFSELNLALVDPAECLKGLNASISKSPAELVPVRPVIEFDMADPRFVREQDVLTTLDARPNLMELTPKEFESLITNLFEKMGLETRLTQPSRDGGVDCVAYDGRPIFGGKVVIQAKRYKNTVGVSAVRDLFGTMQNEGASKGILVTTSGYGQASHEFANGKPLELIDGGNLLYLLKEHAEIDAKIEPPEDWVDPEPDAEWTGPRAAASITGVQPSATFSRTLGSPSQVATETPGVAQDAAGSSENPAL
jgi:restriction system protein